MTILGALQVGVVLAGIAPTPLRQRPTPPETGDEIRARHLYIAQRSLNLAQGAIKRAEALKGERARQSLEQLKQMEAAFRKQIEDLGGKPAPEAGELTFDDLPTTQELNEAIRTRTLNSYRRSLASTRETIRKVEAMGDGENKARNLEELRRSESFYLREIENLERGNLMPVMPVAPRKDVRRD
jgi:hypothetical protein